MFACTACDRGILAAYCPRGHSGNCPCDPVEIECDRCHGTGMEPCGWCGEDAAVVRVDGVLLCARCEHDMPLEVAAMVPQTMPRMAS